MPIPAAKCRTVARFRNRSSLAAAAPVAVACLPWLLGACSSTGRGASPEQRSLGAPAQSDEFLRLGYRVEWRGFPTVLPGGSITSLDILGDAVGVLDSHGVFTLLDARGGSMRWSDEPATQLTRFFGSLREGNRVYLTSETETFVYDAVTGTLAGKLAMPQVVSTRPVKVGDVLVYGTPVGTFFGLAASSGFNVWGSGVRGGIEMPAVPFGTSGVFAISSGTGEVVVFEGLTGHGVGRSRLFGGPGATPATSNTLAFIPSTDHSLYALTRDNGQVLWQHRTDAPLTHAPGFNEGSLYVDLGAEGFSAFEAGTGKKVWSNTTVHGDAVCLRKGRLLVFDAGHVSVLDPAKGTTIDTVDLKAVSTLRPESFADSAVYAVTPAGIVTRLVPR